MDGWVLSGILLFLGLAAITVAAFRLRSWRGVRDAKAFHEATFHTSPDAVLISRLDDGHLEEINQGAARLYGYTREQAVGRTTVELGLWESAADR